jgi:hypothetical protein
VKKAGATTGQCQERSVNGNLNCCKRTPGNDLVITNGCGANNICVGFNVNDQCEVNQHSLYCNPCCPDGNIYREGGKTVIENGKVKITAACDSKCKNEQGSKGLPAIYPINFCTTESVKWIDRPGNNPTDIVDVSIFSNNGTIASMPLPKAPAVSCATPDPQPGPVCQVADDCYAQYPTMICPSCSNGVCVDIGDVNSTSQELLEFASSVKGNLNCCKRTPGTSGIITNGCGANNICIGFNKDDQCEVNSKAAYCNPFCPDGNIMMSDGKFQVENGSPKLNHTVIGTEACNVTNNNGKDNNGFAKPIPPIFPMWYCNCRDIKWKATGAGPTDTVQEWCVVSGGSVTSLTSEIGVDTSSTPSLGCKCNDYDGNMKDCNSCSACVWTSSSKTCAEKGV